MNTARPPAALAVLLLHGLLGLLLWQTVLRPADGRAGEQLLQVLQVRLSVANTALPAAVPELAPPSSAPPPSATPLSPPVVSLAAADAVLPAEPRAEARAEAPSHFNVNAAPPAALVVAATSVVAAPPPAAVPAPAASPPPAPARQSADHRACARAPYPAALRERGIEGELRLRVHVAPDGRAAEVQLLASSGWRLFDEAALAQVRGCRFRPARQGEQAVDDWVEFPVRFALDG